jgi:hypothetical protein
MEAEAAEFADAIVAGRRPSGRPEPGEVLFNVGGIQFVQAGS